MPELPEVEVTRLTLAPLLEGARIRDAHLGKPLRWPLGVAPSLLVGRTFGPPARRGKYLWLPFADHGAPAAAAQDAPGGPTGGPTGSQPGSQPGGLLVHLGMSGSLTFLPLDPDAAGATAAGPHDHVRIQTDRGELRLTDPRRFGAVVWSPSLQEPPARGLLAGLGLEPDDPALTPAWFHEQLHKRRAPIKQVLLAGDVMVGAGNIYACEALFDAGIDPRTRACRLTRPRTARLLASLQLTLARALAAGGSTLRDFRDVHGMSGAFQQQARVYGREGEPCTACGTPIRRIVMGQRSTYFCPTCQRR